MERFLDDSSTKLLVSCTTVSTPKGHFEVGVSR